MRQYGIPAGDSPLICGGCGRVIMVPFDIFESRAQLDQACAYAEARGWRFERSALGGLEWTRCPECVKPDRPDRDRSS